MANPLDLSKFKKVSSDEHCTTLKHAHGHEIRVMHAKLSPKHLEKLKALPHYSEGGDVKKNPKLEEANKKENTDQKMVIMDQQATQRAQDSLRKAFHFADGGQIDQRQAAQDSMRKAFHFADGTPEGPIALPSQMSSNMSDDPMHAKLVESLFNLTKRYNQEPSAPQPAPQEAPQPQSMPQPQPQVVEQPQSQTNLIQQSQSALGQANKAEMTAAKNTAASDEQKSQIFGNQAQQMQDLSHKYEQAGQELHQKYDQLAEQVKTTQIDPNHWWESKSTGSKILTAIGMMFAGAGAGVSGHPEMANKAIDDAIERDINSQKANLGKQENLMSKYMEMYRSLPEAEAAARMTLNAGIEGMINQQAAKLGSQNAIATAQLANATRRQTLLPHMKGLAKAQMMMGMYGQMSQPQQPSGSQEQDYQNKMERMRVVNPDLGKDMEAKYLPGVGSSRVPVPDKLREEIASRKDLSDKLAQLENFAREHSGSLDPKTINQGKAMAAQVQDAYRTAHQQGVFKESEKNFLESILHADPTAFFANVRVIPGYKEARKFNDQTVKQYYKSYGIKPFGQDGETATMNGAQYRKVQGGWEKIE